ncbi:MAG: hypothetical protein RIC89_19750 [Pseudomonadales bacterium]
MSNKNRNEIPDEELFDDLYELFFDVGFPYIEASIQSRMTQDAASRWLEDADLLLNSVMAGQTFDLDQKTTQNIRNELAEAFREDDELDEEIIYEIVQNMARKVLNAFVTCIEQLVEASDEEVSLTDGLTPFGYHDFSLEQTVEAFPVDVSCVQTVLREFGATLAQQTRAGKQSYARLPFGLYLEATSGHETARLFHAGQIDRRATYARLKSGKRNSGIPFALPLNSLPSSVIGSILEDGWIGCIDESITAEEHVVLGSDLLPTHFQDRFYERVNNEFASVLNVDAGDQPIIDKQVVADAMTCIASVVQSSLSATPFVVGNAQCMVVGNRLELNRTKKNDVVVGLCSEVSVMDAFNQGAAVYFAGRNVQLQNGTSISSDSPIGLNLPEEF